MTAVFVIYEIILKNYYKKVKNNCLKMEKSVIQ